MIPKPSTPDTTELERECHSLWAFLVLHPRRCLRCGHTSGKWEDFDAHHVIHRTKKGLLYDTENGACLCQSCHRYFVHSGKERLFVNWFMEKFPARYASLELKRRTLAVWVDLEKVEKGLIEQIQKAGKWEEYERLTND